MTGRSRARTNIVPPQGGLTYNPTVRQSDGPTVRYSDGPIVRQSDSPTVQ